MFNPFKNHKVNETPKVASIEEAPQAENLSVEQLETLEPQENLVDSESIDIRLEALTDYFNQCEANGIEMTKEMVETEIRDRLGLEVEELLGKEITDPEIKMTHQEIIDDIKQIMSQKAESTGTPLSILRDKVFKSKFAKAAFVTAMLLLKFNPAAGANHKETKTVDKDTNKTELSFKKMVSPDGNDGKTFKAEAADFHSVDGNIVISATNNFETDKANLKDAEHLASEFDKFLSSIDETNFKNLINQDWTIKGSSDERKTSWEGGNEGLTKARIEAVKSVVEKTLASHNFAGQLSADQIKQILAKTISEQYPVNGAEKGVTYLTDLVNEDTNEPFTVAEIKIMKEKDPREYQKLLDQCRYTNFELTAHKDAPKIEKLDPIKRPPVTLEIPVEKNKIPEIPKIIQVSEDYDKYYLLVDNSPSMANTQKNMSKELAHLNIEKPFMLANYSDNLSRIDYEKNSASAALKIMKMDTEHSSSNEYTFSAAIKFLEKIEKDEQKKIKNNEVLPHGVMYISTDETLQDVNRLDQLKELCVKTNTKVEVLVFHDYGRQVLRLSLDDVQKQITANNLLKLHDYDKNGKLISEHWVLKHLADANGKIIIKQYN